MFIAALFTIAKTWQQPKCPTIDGLIKKMWYIDTMEYSVQFRIIKKNEIMPFTATWKDLEIVILSEVSQTEKTYCITQRKKIFLIKKINGSSFPSCPCNNLYVGVSEH
uniref:DUF1725 domain-containing protein n=1 Tax=Bos mutus grunniens TaxID=30521 RepID=A0A8B9WAQ7_BOSMU